MEGAGICGEAIAPSRRPSSAVDLADVVVRAGGDRRSAGRNFMPLMGTVNPAAAAGAEGPAKRGYGDGECGKSAHGDLIRMGPESRAGIGGGKRRTEGERRGELRAPTVSSWLLGRVADNNFDDTVIRVDIREFHVAIAPNRRRSQGQSCNDGTHAVRAAATAALREEGNDCLSASN